MKRAVFATRCRPSGAGLPYPEPDRRLKDILVTAIRTAWEQLRRGEPGVIAHGLEDQITVKLEEQLNTMLDEGTVPGFELPTFWVVRGAEVTSADGMSSKSRPDLVFRLFERNLKRPADYALHTECKPVGPSPHNISHYCDNEGIGRFVRGVYGNKMSLGLMIAYAARGYTLGNTLIPKLQVTYGESSDPYQTRCMPVCYSAIHPGDAVMASSHGRSWRYDDGTSPGDVALIHIWLDR